MSDLISREKVIDVLKETGIIQDNDLGHLVVDEINRIPTAYDVEAVVEKLDKACFSASDDYPGYVIDVEYAVDIVEAGGKE